MLLTALVFGGAAHAWHHATDRDCESTASPVSHPCTTCAGLHAAPLGEQPVTVILPRPVAFACTAASAILAPRPAPRHQTAPRAPPVA